MRASQLRSCLPIALLIGLVSTASAQHSPVKVEVDKQVAVTDEGTAVDRYTMSNSRGMRVAVLTYGATITGVWVPDRDGQSRNVTLHFEDPARYLEGHPLFGSIVGRYANRIADARFEIDGREYSLVANAGKNHIHGGREGFQRLVWSARAVEMKDRAGVEFRHTSPDSHAGYPGKLEVRVQYLLTEDNELVLDYRAITNKPTHVNLTNHAYWNLGGVQSGNVLDHVMMLDADQYLEANAQRFPSGKLLSVAGTPMDFREPHTIGSRIDELDSQNYDDCYVLSLSEPNEPELAARVEHPPSGRVMEVWTTTPGVQFYTAKGLNGQLGAQGVSYGPYHGFCLETQHFPDTPNQPNFPSTLLRPGETYDQKTIFRFRVKSS